MPCYRDSRAAANSRTRRARQRLTSPVLAARDTLTRAPSPPPGGGGPRPPGGPRREPFDLKSSSAARIWFTFRSPIGLSTVASSFMAASRCSGVICSRLIPPRGTNPVGRLDQRALCAASSNVYRTFLRCSTLSEDRNAFAARTISSAGGLCCAASAIPANEPIETPGLILASVKKEGAAAVILPGQ